MAIEVALDMALGNQTVAPEMAAETAPEVWDVRGGSGNRPTIPFLLWSVRGLVGRMDDGSE